MSPSKQPGKKRLISPIRKLTSDEQSSRLNSSSIHRIINQPTIGRGPGYTSGSGSGRIYKKEVTGCFSVPSGLCPTKTSGCAQTWSLAWSVSCKTTSCAQMWVWRGGTALQFGGVVIVFSGFCLFIYLLSQHSVNKCIDQPVIQSANQPD